MNSIFDNPAEIQTIKGFLFVGLSALLIYVLMYQSTKKLFSVEKLTETIIAGFPGIFLSFSDRLYLEYFNQDAIRWLKLSDKYKDKHLSYFSNNNEQLRKIASLIDVYNEANNLAENVIELEDGNQKKYFKLNIFKIGNNESIVNRYIILGIDVTDELLVEEKIKEYEKRYFELFNQAKLGMGILSREGTVLEINNVGLINLNIEPNTISKESIVDYLPEQITAYYKEIIREVVDTKQVVVKEELNLLDNYFLTTYSPIFDADGEVLFIQVISQNITEQKLAEKQLKKLNQELELIVEERTKALTEALNSLELKQEQLLKLNEQLKQSNSKLHKANEDLNSFAHSVSHDLRAPLRSINGFSEILKRKYDEQLDEEGKRILNRIIDNGHKMGRLIDDLLAFSKYGREVLHPAPVNMDKLVDEVLADYTESEKTTDFKISKSELGTAICDPKLVKLVWFNLIENAIKYSSKASIKKIEIGKTVHENKECFFIKDYGCGFDMKYADKLFKVFQRLHHDQEYEGTGVGLAIIERIISKHGGKIIADSKPDHGTTFYFCL
ncbi:MAG: sensor histidine kinase [Flavobacteriales bacterium]